MMHFWSKFGKPHFIWFWLIARTNSQAQTGVNLDFQAQFDLEDHCQSPHKTIGILINVFYISDPNLVILAWTVDELSHGQAHDWRTHRHTHIHTHTHAGNDNTRRPKLASGKKVVKGTTLLTHLSTLYLYLRHLSTLYLYLRHLSTHYASTKILGVHKVKTEKLSLILTWFNFNPSTDK